MIEEYFLSDLSISVTLSKDSQNNDINSVIKIQEWLTI